MKSEDLSPAALPHVSTCTAPQAALPRAPLFLSVVVPAYNEEANLAAFITALGAVIAQDIAPAQFEILIINDGSRDGTHAAALELVRTSGLPLRYLALSRNFGKEAALSAGIDHARGSAVVLIDGDFQHPLALLKDMHKLWLQGWEMIYGVIAERGAEGALKRWGTRGFYALLNAHNPTPVPPNAGDFRWMDRRVVDALKALPERARFMKGLYAWVGFASVALPFVPEQRAAGQTSFNLRRLGALALLGLTAFTNLPLRIWSIIGALIALCSLAYGAYITVDTLIFGADLAGWPTLAAGIMLFSGVQLMSIGILGEYLGRVYDEVKQRPTYLIAHDEDYANPAPPNTPAA